MSSTTKKLVNANILLEDNGYRLEIHNLCIQNGKIVSFDDIVGEKVIDCKGKVIIPSLFNVHCHLGESIFKNIEGNDWTLEKYLKYTTEYNDGLDSENRNVQWLESAEYTIQKCTKNAIANICSARSAEMSRKYGIRNMAGYPIMQGQKLKEYYDEGLGGFKKYLLDNKSESCSVGVFLHSIYMNNTEGLALAKECMKSGADFITVHISEDENTRNKELKTYGRDSVYVLKDYELLSSKSLLVHCGKISDDEKGLIKEANAAIAICPISNSFLNSGMIDIYSLCDVGINWYIASDGLATGRTFSLFEQAEYIKKVYPKLDYAELFKRMTIYPAEHFQVGGYRGIIAENVAADLQ
jgi:cytosine/adenosine deaminase-related metal-dependent hydrolase